MRVIMTIFILGWSNGVHYMTFAHIFASVWTIPVFVDENQRPSADFGQLVDWFHRQLVYEGHRHFVTIDKICMYVMYIKSNLILKVGYSNLECEKHIWRPSCDV